MLAGQHAAPAARRWFDQRGPGSLRDLAGLTPRQFGAVKRNLLGSADAIERINAHFQFGILLCAPHLKYFYPLPRLLRGYVSLLELTADRLGRGTDAYHNFAKAALIAHVHQSTRKYFDGPVSQLIAVVTGPYSEDTHRQWRKQHRHLFALLDANISGKIS